MNERLQFSWGHIIAFIALIAVMYISFVGFTYMTEGNFTYALVGMGITAFLYIIFFIGAQQMKASGVKMARKIIWERFFIFGSPIIFIAGMLSMSHFWTVKAQNDEIVNQFTQAINSSKQLFDDYETYANERIENYDKMLGHIIASRISDPCTFSEAGFTGDMANVQKENMVETLRLQLLSQNYDSLKNVATKWIDNANQGASTWNVFLLGNTREIKDALGNWENQLKSYSTKQLSNEVMFDEIPAFSSNGAANAISGIDGMTSSFTTQKAPNVSALLFGIAIYLMLLFPYAIQERHTKSPYKNIIKKKRKQDKINVDEKATKTSKSTVHRGTFRLE